MPAALANEDPQLVSELREELEQSGYPVGFHEQLPMGSLSATIGPITIVVGDVALALGVSAVATVKVFGKKMLENFADDIYAKFREKSSNRRSKRGDAGAPTRLSFEAQVAKGDTVAVLFTVNADGEQIGSVQALGPDGLRRASASDDIEEFPTPADGADGVD